MNALALLLGIAVVPIVIALIFRVSGVFLFLSAAAGYLLVLYVGDDAGLVLGMSVRFGNVNIMAQLLLLLIPVLLTLLFLKKTLPKHKLLLHLPLQIATGLALSAMALPLLDSRSQEQIFANHYGNLLRESQDMFVGVATVLALLIMWFTYRHKEDKKSKKKHI